MRKPKRRCSAMDHGLLSWDRLESFLVGEGGPCTWVKRDDLAVCLCFVSEHLEDTVSECLVWTHANTQNLPHFRAFPASIHCVNSSPPLISRKFRGFGGIWAISGKFGKFRENSGEFSGIQWGFVWRLVWIQWEFLGDFGAAPDFQENLGFGVVSGDLGGQKAFAQIRLRLPCNWVHQAIAFAIASEFCRKLPSARNFRSDDDIFAISFAKPFAFASEFLPGLGRGYRGYGQSDFLKWFTLSDFCVLAYLVWFADLTLAIWSIWSWLVFWICFWFWFCWWDASCLCNRVVWPDLFDLMLSDLIYCLFNCLVWLLMCVLLFDVFDFILRPVCFNWCVWSYHVVHCFDLVLTIFWTCFVDPIVWESEC